MKKTFALCKYWKNSQEESGKKHATTKKKPKKKSSQISTFLLLLKKHYCPIKSTTPHHHKHSHHSTTLTGFGNVAKGFHMTKDPPYFVFQFVCSGLGNTHRITLDQRRKKSIDNLFIQFRVGHWVSGK
jgi:hypothetical protein